MTRKLTEERKQRIKRLGIGPNEIDMTGITGEIQEPYCSCEAGSDGDCDIHGPVEKGGDN